MDDDSKPETDHPLESSSADETFSDMVSLGPPPVPAEFDDTLWHDQQHTRTPSQAIEELRKRLGNRYERRDELGQGGMATVFDSVDLSLRRHVAVKVIHQRHATKDESQDERSAMQRFIDEAQITAQLEHPNIVPVHEIGVDENGKAFFTMKRIEGRSLRAVFDDMRAGRVAVLEHYSEHTCLDMLIKICDALAFAHSRNVIHRDLKPDNVMVGRFGEVQVMDWGLAKILGPRLSNEPVKDHETFTGRVSIHSEDATHTIEGTISGTPAYMPPEQARGRVSQVDERSDIFLIGALLYEMLTLVPPFHAESSMAALRRAQRYDIPRVRDLAARLQENPELADETILHPLAVERALKAPPELEAIAFKALAEDPKDRYQNVEQMIGDIERYRRGEAVSVFKDPVFRAIGKWAARHRVWTFAAAGMLLMALISTIVILVLEKQADADLFSESQQRQKAEDDRELLKQEARMADEAKRAEALAEREREATENQKRYQALVRRENAQHALNSANDKLSRAAAAKDDLLRRKWRLLAIQHLSEAIKRDPSYGRPYIERGQTYLLLGDLRRAMDNLLEGNHLQREHENLRDDPALMMTIAMIALTEQRVLGHRNSDSVYVSALRRIQATRANEKAYHELASLLLDAHQLEDSYYRENNIRKKVGIFKKLDELVARVEAIKGNDLWEVYLFAGALQISQAGRQNESEAEIKILNAAIVNFDKALSLQPQLPVVVSFKTEASALLFRARTQSPVLHKTRVQWNDYINEFPDDPLGFYARARLCVNQPDFYQSVAPAIDVEIARAEADLRAALELNHDFSEAQDALGLLAERRGDFEEALAAYRDAFDSWSPLVELPPTTPWQSPNQMSFGERYVRLCVRLDAMNKDTGPMSLTIPTLKTMYRRCVEDSENPAIWANFEHTAAVYRFVFSVATEAALKHQNIELLLDLVNEAALQNPEEQDYLDMASVLAKAGEFSSAQRMLSKVYPSNIRRVDLEAEIIRYESAIAGNEPELSAEEMLHLSRMQERLIPNAQKDLDRLVESVIGATLLASAKELKTTIEATLKARQADVSAASQIESDRILVRLFKRYLIEAPKAARALALKHGIEDVAKRLANADK